MWWINKNGNIEGPFSSEQLEKRVKLNMLRSLDRVSEDKAKWFYVKDTVFWNPTRTIKDPPPPPPSRSQHMTSPNIKDESLFDGPIMARPAEPVSGSGRAAIPSRFRIDVPVERPSSNRGLWVALIAFVVIALVGFGVMAYFMVKNSAIEVDVDAASDAEDSEVEKPVPPTPQVGFNSVKDKLIIIECNEGSGSGFLLAMDGKVYLMTNEHVVRSTGTPRARLLDGTPLNLGAFSVATDRDLARFEVIGCSIKPFEISAMLPNTGDMVAVYGNSLGGGVATESKGFIQGVGPHRLETNNEIVPGNSGSPLVATDGKVLGVAAFIDRHGSDEWTVKNTRYEGTPRRFAIRFTNVSWKPIDRLRYEQQIANLKEYETYWGYLLPYLCFDSTKVDEGLLIFNDMKSKDFKLKKHGYEEMLTTLTKAYKKRNKSLDQWSDRCKARKAFIQRLVDNEVSEEDGKRAIAEYDQKTTEMFEKVKEAFRNMILKRKEALMNAQSILTEGPWDAPQVLNGYSKDDRNGSIEWYREGVQYFMDLMNQKLKDFNKEIEAIEKGDIDEDDE